MADVQRYHEFLKGQLRAMVEETNRYVAIESGSRDKEGVDRVGVEVAKAFEALGFAIETIPMTEVGNSIVARRKGNGRGKLIAHIHLDTTQPRGMILEHPIEERGDRLYGPGVMDMKGGWVALLGAIRALDNAGWDGLEEFTVFLTGDEELGSTYARPYIEAESAKCDWQVIFEPSRDPNLLTIQRGVVGAIYFTIHGEPGVANMRTGASAVAEAAHKILALEQIADVERGNVISVGIVEGGEARQIVPAKAWLSIDLRAENQEAGEELVRRVREIAEQTFVPGTRTEMTGGITRPAFKRNEGNVRMLELAKEVGRELGLDIQPADVSRGGSDGSFGAAMGIASLDGLGAVGGSDNGRQFIYINSLAVKGALLAGIITRLPELL